MGHTGFDWKIRARCLAGARGVTQMCVKRHVNTLSGI